MRIFRHFPKSVISHFLLFSVPFGLFAFTGGRGALSMPSTAAAERPNIVFILADDLGWRDLSGEGSTFYESPHLDRLANSGMRFTQGYATCQVCSPSRASVMTGKFPARHGITDWIGAASGMQWDRDDKVLPAEYEHRLNSEDTTVAEALQEAGYRTFFAGKWHLGGEGSFPEDHGFEFNVGGNHRGSPPGGFFSPYNNPQMEDGPAGESLPIRLSEETANFIEEHQEEPFFAFLSFYSVHAPIQTERDLWEKYREKASRDPHQGDRFLFDRTLPVRQVQDCPIYAGMIESMDRGVGIVLDTLQRLELDENTIVVFTSDNGGVSSGDAYATSNLPLRGGKGRQWEGGIREPVFVRAPGVTSPESESSTPMTGADFYPTLLELAGLAPRPEQHVDGVSLVPLLRGDSIADRPLFWHYPHYGNQGGEPSSIIRRGDWKLIHYWEDGRDELYDLASDPVEQQDRSADEPQRRNALRAELDEWLADVGAKIPKPDPRYNPDRAAKKLEKNRTVLKARLEQQHARFLEPDFQPNPTWWGSLTVEDGVDEESAAAFPTPENSQPETERFLSPSEALATVEAPEGFTVELFAAEPDVQQPIAMTTDPRGRLWVAENYTYADSQTNYDLSLRDRIVILSDTNGDGAADERTVFWDQAQRLTSIEIGFGGVWVLAPPQLLFIPDADGDDRPDGPPQVMLDGWDANKARHNFANGLRWGPDGWLYGRSGITMTSHVGQPGSADSERTAISCGIWRFHPVSHRFEVVCHGTTNPWGMDWDQHGELFFINTVIGHLWHAVPGAHFQRMFGEDFNPRLYELVPQTADHVHWDEKSEPWTAQSKGVSSGTDLAGGGHAHSGMMIYQGDNWPDVYRGKLFTLNLHGRRINCDSLHRHGATYVGRHRPDLLSVGDPWFRGIELCSGPDGEVYILDWSDIGECHENDGVHRTSGRIYTVRAEEAINEKPFAADLSNLEPSALVERLFHPDVWHARQARQLLQQHHAAGNDVASAMQLLRELLTAGVSPEKLLRAVWALHVTEQLDSQQLQRLLEHESEHVRVWAVRFLAERVEASPESESIERLVKLTGTESSGLVLTYLASSLQRMPATPRWKMARDLLQHQSFADDPVLPLMIWYGIEPLATQQPEQAVDCLITSRMPKVTRFVTRSLMNELPSQPAVFEELLRRATTAPSATQLAVLQGMQDGMRGRQRAQPPATWKSFASAMNAHSDPAAAKMVAELAVVFGDGRATSALLELISNSQQPVVVRRDAIETLVDVRANGLGERLVPLMTERELGESAIAGLAAIGLPGFADKILRQYARLQPNGKHAAIAALVQRPEWAATLLDAVQADQIRPDDLPATALRQIQLLGKTDLTARVQAIWPGQRLLPADRLAKIHALKEQLTPSRLESADRVAGRQHFQRLCASCHQLFDEGEAIGPKLTGGQRDNLVFWLENIIDPSAAVADNYRIQVVLLNDGRVLNGVVLSRTETQLVLQTAKERVTLDPAQVEEIRSTEASLMPDGLLDPLDEEEISKLLAYLMSPRQVGLPEAN